MATLHRSKARDGVLGGLVDSTNRPSSSKARKDRKPAQSIFISTRADQDDDCGEEQEELTVSSMGSRPSSLARGHRRENGDESNQSFSDSSSSCSTSDVELESEENETDMSSQVELDETNEASREATSLDGKTDEVGSPQSSTGDESSVESSDNEVEDLEEDDESYDDETASEPDSNIDGNSSEEDEGLYSKDSDEEEFRQLAIRRKERRQQAMSKRVRSAVLSPMVSKSVEEKSEAGMRSSSQDDSEQLSICGLDTDLDVYNNHSLEQDGSLLSGSTPSKKSPVQGMLNEATVRKTPSSNDNKNAQKGAESPIVMAEVVHSDEETFTVLEVEPIHDGRRDKNMYVPCEIRTGDVQPSPLPLTPLKPHLEANEIVKDLGNQLGALSVSKNLTNSDIQIVSDKPAAIADLGKVVGSIATTRRLQPLAYETDQAALKTKAKPSVSFASNIKPKRRVRQVRREGSIKCGKWNLGAKIGSGAFGVVRVGFNTKNGKFLAVKSVPMKRKAVIKDAFREILLLKSLDHPNVVHYFGAEIDDKYLHIFQELVSGGSVAGMLNKFGVFSLEVLQSYVSQILHGLSYLHEHRIMHRDIKGSNVLVSNDGVVKLADFGASKQISQLDREAMMSLTTRGTPYFMAPEVFEERYSFKADIWSVGCVAIQMATGDPPFKKLGITNQVALFNHIKALEDGCPPLEDLPVTNSTRPMYDKFSLWVSKCFRKDAQKRPTASELATDAFFDVSEFTLDDESIEDRGLFSPSSTDTWGMLQSPECSKRSPPPRRRSCDSSVDVASRSPYFSPPISRRRRTERSPLPLSPKPNSLKTGPRRLPQSPKPDDSQWPTWARERHESIQKLEVTSGVTQSKTIDSLAFSESTAVSNDGRRLGTKDGNSDSLFGLDLVGSSLENSESR